MRCYTKYYVSSLKIKPKARVFLFSVNPVHGGHYTESALTKVWSKVRQEAKIEKKDLRLYEATKHSIGSNLSNSGTDLKKSRDMMGHADIRTTMKYTHGNVEHLRVDLNKLTLKRSTEVIPINVKREMKGNSINISQ